MRHAGLQGSVSPISAARSTSLKWGRVSQRARCREVALLVGVDSAHTALSAPKPIGLDWRRKELRSSWGRGPKWSGPPVHLGPSVATSVRRHRVAFQARWCWQATARVLVSRASDAIPSAAGRYRRVISAEPWEPRGKAAKSRSRRRRRGPTPVQTRRGSACVEAARAGLARSSRAGALACPFRPVLRGWVRPGAGSLAWRTVRFRDVLPSMVPGLGSLLHPSFSPQQVRDPWPVLEHIPPALSMAYHSRSFLRPGATGQLGCRTLVGRQIGV